MFESSEDYDFVPSGNSKLSSLFDNTILSEDKNSSLTYTAPKQTKIKSEVDVNDSVRSKPQTSVIIAQVVSLWKLENKDYKSLGKHGLAIIGSQDLNLFEIIVYKEKNNILLRKVINKNCNFSSQKDLFCSFYDNEEQNWLVKFENLNDQTIFCDKLKKFGGNIINNIESSHKTEKPTATARPSEATKDTNVKQEILPWLSETLEQNADENSDSSGSVKRANILSRMAKMGLQILPHQILKNTSTDISDSELDDTKNDRKAPPRKFKRSLHSEKHIPHEETLAPALQNDSTEYQMVPSHSNNLNFPVQVPHTMVSPLVYNQSVPYDGFGHYLMAQNTELKVNLAQISSKLDTVLSSGNKSFSTTEDKHFKSKIKSLELKLENLEAELQIHKEFNYSLQKECNDLKEKNKKDTEREETCIIENLRKEIDNLNLTLKESKEKSSNYEQLENQIEKFKSDIKEYEEVIRMQKIKLIELETFYEKNKGNENLQNTIDNLNETVLKLTNKSNYFEEYYRNTEEEKQKRNDLNKTIMDTFSDKIKEQMNNMYQSIIENFDEDSSCSLSDVRVQVARNLKATTFKIIDEFRDIYKNQNISISSE